MHFCAEECIFARLCTLLASLCLSHHRSLSLFLAFRQDSFALVRAYTPSEPATCLFQLPCHTESQMQCFHLGPMAVLLRPAVPSQEPHDLEWLCVAPPCDSPVAAGSSSAESSQLSDFTPSAAAAQPPEGEARTGRKKGSRPHLDPPGPGEDLRADAPTRIRSKSANKGAIKGRGLSGSASDARGLLAATCSTPSIQHLLSAASGVPSQGVTGIGLRSMVAESGLPRPRGQETQQPRLLTWLPLALSKPGEACDKRAAQTSLHRWRVHVWRLPPAPARGMTRGRATWSGRPNARCCSVVPTSVATRTKAVAIIAQTASLCSQFGWHGICTLLARPF